MSILKIDVDDIERLSDIQLTELLKYLLHLEAQSSGIQQSAISVALNINAGDGGEDGRIKWEEGPATTDFLPSRFVQFQCKATDMGPASCANEVVGNDSKIKPMVNAALMDGATYILFVNKTLNEQQIQARIEAIRSKFIEKSADYAETASIDIYDASKIASWINLYLSAIVLVSEYVKRTIVSGMQTWEFWRKGEDISIPFILDEDREEFIASIRSTLSQPKQAIRLIGGSGLGKTRLALEVFRAQSDEDFLYTQVVYCDMANEIPGFSAQVIDLVKEGIECILIVDNCTLALHQQLVKTITHPSSSISLLTLDYSGTDDTPFIEIKPMANEHIKAMLETVYKDKIKDLHKIVDFAHGFPQMAVLLAKARLKDDPEMGSLTDPVLLEKMLWGNDESNENAKQAIQGFALFEKFGISDDVEDQFDFIANNVVELSPKECFRHITDFKRKGIIDQKGRFGSVVPKPLAIRLSAEFWGKMRTSDAITLIEKDFPGDLANALCTNIAKLDFMPHVKEIVADLCGEQRPFGQAEVILSNLGSRLFRSLVEVNPEATMNALYRVLSPMSKEEILSITGDVRRNLIWSLEKLSFRKLEFQNAARLLLRLAVSENESWSNNATGQFVQLFQTYLSGTEAPPGLRLVIIDEAIESGDSQQLEIVIKALEKAISFGYDSRSGGAESQGSGKPLKDWEPKIWQDVFDYWDGAIKRLTDIIITNETLKESAKQAIAHNIRGLVAQGRIESVDTALRTIVEHDGKFWPDAIKNINHSIKYDSEAFPKEGQKKLYEWLELLKPDDITERLKLIISVPPYTYNQDDEGNFIDQARIDAEALSKEIVEKPGDLMDNLPIVLTGEQRQARTLGRIFAEELDDISDYIEKGLSILKTVEFPNPELLIAMMDIQKNKEKSIWDAFIATVIKDDDLVKFLPRFLQTSKPSVNELQLIIDQIKTSRLEITALRHFGSGMSLHHLSVDDIQHLVSELLKLKEEGAWIALDIISMYTHSSKERFDYLAETAKQVLLQLEYETTNNQVMDFYYLEQAIKRLTSLEVNEEFIVAISENIFKQVFDQDYNIMYNLKKIVHYLIKEQGDIVWPVLFKYIEELSPIQEFRMEQMIGRRNNLDSDFALVDSIPDEKIIDLCKQSEKSARALAKSIKVITEVENEWKFTSIAKRMIDEFGDQERVLSAISSNLYSFFWSGSSVPYYQRQKNAFKDLLSHRNENVREWAKNELLYLGKRIKDEQQSDEEHDFGIY